MGGMGDGNHELCYLCDREALLEDALRQIEEADYVYAILDKCDAYGTIAEIGYAAALGKFVRVEFSQSLKEESVSEMWFCKMMADPGGECPSCRYGRTR